MRERAIRDNEHWGEWSDGLALVLRSLEGQGSDISLLGLDDDHVERLLAAALQGESGEPADLDLTPPETATTKPGHLHELGPHRLICGDARDPEIWSRLLGETASEAVDRRSIRLGSTEISSLLSFPMDDRIVARLAL